MKTNNIQIVGQWLFTQSKFQSDVNMKQYKKKKIGK